MSRRLSIRTTVAVAGALVALAGVGVVGSASAAPVAPPTVFETTPPSVNFGTVLVGAESIKPVKMINRSKNTLYYEGAEWPNFQNPLGTPYPYGFWNRSFDPYPCYEIAPKSSCTLMFGFMAYAPGKVESYFTPTYGDGYDSYTDTTLMRGTGIAPAS